MNFRVVQIKSSTVCPTLWACAVAQVLRTDRDQQQHLICLQLITDLIVQKLQSFLTCLSILRLFWWNRIKLQVKLKPIMSIPTSTDDKLTLLVGALGFIATVVPKIINIRYSSLQQMSDILAIFDVAFYIIFVIIDRCINLLKSMWRSGPALKTAYFYPIFFHVFSFVACACQ